MLKNLNKIDEIEHQHKADAQTKLGKIIEKKDNTKKNKLINPKFIFEKKPKNTKKGNFRAPEINSKGPPIKEDII
jgi:hypothetical protein